jgi:hypothetical protein
MNIFGVVFVHKQNTIMKIMRTTRYLLIIIIVVIYESCTEIRQVVPEPYIEYKSFSVFDTTDILGNSCKGGKLKFYFEDGDGNLGLEPPEATEGDTTNLFFTLFRKIDGEMQQVDDDDPMKPSSYRIPYMEREGQNKILKGTIYITFIYLFYEVEDNDTIRYDFYLKDRADNLSNTVSTNEIPLSFNGIY